MWWLLVVMHVLFQPVELMRVSFPHAITRPTHRENKHQHGHSLSNDQDPTNKHLLGKSVKILILRHGSTEWNSSPQYKKLHSVLQDTTIGVYIPGRYDFNKTLLDSVLSPLGILQSKQAGQLLREKYPNVRYVFVSPLVRAVQTALLATQGLKKTPEYRVVPWLREGISSITSLGWNCYEYLNKYPFIKGVERIRDDKLWFLDYWDSFNDANNYKGQLLEYCRGNHTVEKILDFLTENRVPKLENPLQLEAMAKNSLEEIRAFLVDKMQKEAIDVQDYQVLVVGHRRVLKPLLQSLSSTDLFDWYQMNGEITEGELRLD